MTTGHKAAGSNQAAQSTTPETDRELERFSHLVASARLVNMAGFARLLEHQRDDLLAALLAVDEAMWTAHEVQARRQACLDNARAAIAKAKP